MGGSSAGHIFTLQDDISSVKIPSRLFKTLSKYLSSLILELLAYLCPKVEYDVTNDSGIFRKVKFECSWLQRKVLIEYYHKNSFK